MEKIGKKVNYKVLLFILVALILVFSGRTFYLNNSTHDKKITNREQWQGLIDKKGGQDGYEEFKKVMDKEKDFVTRHLASHVFGELLFENEGTSGFAICDDSFNFGCYHGFFTQAIASSGTDVIQQLHDTCTESFNEFRAISCKHGIGHGLVEYLGHSKESLDKALLLCETPGYDEHFFLGCYSGVFMEYNQSIITSRETAEIKLRKLDENNPYYPCNEIPERFKSACYQQIAKWWEKVYNYDYALIGNLCKSIGDAKYKTDCFRAMGHVIAQYSDYNLEKIISRCNQALEGRTLCKITAAWTIVGEKGDKSKASKLCESLPLEDRCSIK